ncbi:MAG: hypothetical protein ACKOC5_10215 [Chloroflexota bacterium]
MAWLDDFYRREHQRLIYEREQNQPPSATTPSIPTGLEADRAHLYNPLAAILAPAAQALVSGLIYGLAALVLAWLTDRPEPWRWGAAAFVVAQAVIWSTGLARWMSLTKPLNVLDWAERLLARDIDGDGAIAGEVIPAPQIVRIEIKQQNGQAARTNILDLPIDGDRLQQLAAGLAAGQPLSEAEWSGGGRPLSRNEFRQVRQALLDRGLATWTSELDRRQGVRLTADGLTVFQAMAAGAPSPTLAERNP